MEQARANRLTKIYYMGAFFTRFARENLLSDGQKALNLVLEEMKNG